MQRKHVPMPFKADNRLSSGVDSLRLNADVTGVAQARSFANGMLNPRKCQGQYRKRMTCFALLWSDRRTEGMNEKARGCPSSRYLDPAQEGPLTRTLK
jgi:hypothetical protein